MRDTPANALPLQPAHAQFIQGGVSVIVASSSQAGEPSLTRGIGCKVADDRRSVTLYVRRSQCAALLADLERSRRVAAVFCQPSTHRTLQIKGSDARVGAPAGLDAAAIAAQAEAFHAELAPLGYAHGWTLAVLGYAPEDVVAVTFAPEAVFSQTPGPKAGERLA